jgi:hypothetical protein
MYIYTPYTYLIGWSKLNKWYYGCSYKSKTKIANPEQLWKSYFTSSKKVKQFRKLHGEPDIIQIRKTFNTAEDALKWESKVILRMKMVESDIFLNQRNMSGQFKNKGGYKHSEKSKENYRKSFTDERRITISKRLKGVKRKSTKGYKRSEESKENYRKSFTDERRRFLSELSVETNKNRTKESRQAAGKSNSKTRKENREKYIGENSPLFGINRTEEDKTSIAIGTKEAMDDPALREHLSEKAKLRCTPEWRAKKAEENKYRICCIKCHREMGRSSLGKHRMGRKCI